MASVTVVGAQESAPSEESVKAAFVYNFAKLVEWPPDAAPARTGSVVLCLLAGAGDIQAFDALSGRYVADVAVTIRRLSVTDAVSGCHLLFIPEVSETRYSIDDVLARSRTSQTLTISDLPGFAAHGGVIQLLTIEGKIRFEINRRAARDAGLEISSRLLQLAVTVHDDVSGNAK